MTADRGGTAASISRQIHAFRPYNRMQMQLGSEAQIPDGLLAANTLLGENSHQGVPTSTHALYQGFGFVISNTALGLKRSLYDEGVGSRYTGKERDAESGLDYFGARHYASSIGRFMSPDPSGLYYADPKNPQSLNMYSYVMNNPLKFLDPSGLRCQWEDNTEDDSVEDGGATYDQCSDQGGKWNEETNVTVQANNNGSQIDLISTESSGQFISYVPPADKSCRSMNSAQRLVVAGLSKVAKATNLTVGYGLGGNIGVGYRGFGISFSASQQLLVSPDGTAGLATTYTPQPFGASTTGSGGIVGAQLTANVNDTFEDNAGVGVDGGITVADGYAGAIDLSNSGVTLTGGIGFGGYGRAGTLTYTVTSAFCTTP